MKIYNLVLLITILFISSCVKKTFDQKPNVEKLFVIVIPSYNNSNWYKKNLDSVLSQNYKNYRIIYIDDNSDDQTYALVKKYVQKKKIKNITLIKNEKRIGALGNHYNAIQICKDNEIIVSLDGDDWFANNYVLSYLNDVYQDQNIWMTYGQFINWPTNKIGWCKKYPQETINKNAFREYGFFAAQPRTYYAWLAKKIEIKDLLDENKNFYFVAGDTALMFPLLEMSANHTKFITNILYVRNVENPINDFKVNKNQQIKLTKLIRDKEKYKALDYNSSSTCIETESS